MVLWLILYHLVGAVNVKFKESRVETYRLIHRSARKFLMWSRAIVGVSADYE